MLNRIDIRNFKCFQGTSVPLNALTIFSGINGVGKSTTIQSLLLLRQSLLNYEQRKRMAILNGPLVSLGYSEDILYENRTQKAISDTIYHKLLNIPKDEEGIYKFGKNDLFAMVIILKQMLEKDEFIDFLRELEYEINLLDSRVNTVPLNSILNRIGFPDNWFKISKI